MSKGVNISSPTLVKIKELRYVSFLLFDDGNIRIEARGLKRAVSKYVGEVALTKREQKALYQFLADVIYALSV